MTDLERLKIVVRWLVGNGVAENQAKLGEMMGYSNKSSFSQVLNGKVALPGNFIAKICKFDSRVNRHWIETGQGDMLNSSIKSDLKEKTYASHIPVKLVMTSARAGFAGAYYAEEFLEDMPTILIESDKEYKGKYLAFEVDGDSMEPDYLKGDIVICREVRRDLWQYKLHYDEWDFVIAHGTKGIMLKEIIDHDVATGEITCHSVNHEEHPDFVLNLREVAYLYNVVEVRRSGRNKHRFRS